jgi:cobalamin biosynthesis protein CobT
MLIPDNQNNIDSNKEKKIIDKLTENDSDETQDSKESDDSDETQDSEESDDNDETHDSEESDDNDETHDSQESDDELSSDSSPLSFTDNSDLYVVSINNSPRFYVKDEKTALKKMWEVAHKLAGTELFTGCRTNFLQISHQELHLLGSYRFFIIAYDTILHRISYSRVQECT